MAMYARKDAKVYSKAERKWVNKETERKSDLEGCMNQAGVLLLTYWRMYPDRFLALCEAEKPDYSLAFIQCVMLRALCRDEEVDETGGRGVTKSYTGLLSRMVLGVLYPGIIENYFGPSIKQVAKIASDTYDAICKNYPLLVDMYNVVTRAEARFKIVTKYLSVIDVDVMRGTNGSGVFAEEVAQQEAGEQFDHEKFRGVVLPAIRIMRMPYGTKDPMFPHLQKGYATSAGRQQNESFQYRKDIVARMKDGERAFAMDIPGEVAVLNGIRPLSWFNDMKRKLTPEEWLREMCARYTGACENPVIRDSTLTESKSLMVMEDRHCGDPNAIYIISNDVAYSDGARNAKSATIVLKLEPQREAHKRDKYLKSVVYALDERPREGTLQAKELKRRWERYCMDGGQTTYIAIDARSYGQAVLEDLHKDLGDGLPPLCCVNHERRDIELEGALPVIFPINAVGGTAATGATAITHDSDPEMLRYAEVEWEQRNVRILTSNINEGVLAYKRMHRIKDDTADATIATPYIKTRELAGQISNLRKKTSGAGFKEERISKAVNRDMWSATKYALRTAQRLEYLNRSNKRENAWTKLFRIPDGETIGDIVHPERTTWTGRPRITERTGGNLRWR